MEHCVSLIFFNDVWLYICPPSIYQVLLTRKISGELQKFVYYITSFEKCYKRISLLPEHIECCCERNLIL